jgi:hypothetical protein
MSDDWHSSTFAGSKGHIRFIDGLKFWQAKPDIHICAMR